MNKLNELYKLKDIITYLNNYQILAGINYQNCDNNFPKISKFLNENQINYINIIKKNEEDGLINFTLNEMSLIPKYFDEKKNLIYIEDFEIIDEKFITFLCNKFINLPKTCVYFGLINDTIYLNINHEQRNLFEIMSFNKDNTFTFACFILR